MKGFKTYLGIVVAVVAGLAGAFDVQPASLPAWVDQLFVVLGGILAAYGRYDKERRAPGA